MAPTLARDRTAGKGRAIRPTFPLVQDVPGLTVNELATHLPLKRRSNPWHLQTFSPRLQSGRPGRIAFEHLWPAVRLLHPGVEGKDHVMSTVFRSLAFAAALAISGASAQAVTVSYQGSGPFNGTSSAGVTVTSIADPVTTVSAKAGGFALKGNIFGNGEENFVAWCLDILHYLANNRDYEVTNTPFTGDPLTKLQVTNIGRLFNTAYAGLALNVQAQSAGFQLALWEIIYENPDNAFNLKSGNLSVTKGHQDVINAGQAYLDKLSGPVTQRWNLVFLQSTTENQNLVTATPVPVPAAAGLMLLALGGLVAAGRRRPST
jgi:hypothetical protein